MLRIVTIICTMNRPDDLARALASLAACDPSPTQVLVSDDSPEGDRRSEISADRPGVAYQRGPRRGLGANRNASVAAVGGDADWVHFIDDDVIVPTDFYHRAAEAIGDVAGPTVLSGHEWKHTPSETEPVLVRPPRAGFWMHLETRTEPSAGNCVVINATLFPRLLLSRAAFDERMRYGCEEIDFSRQANWLGYQISYAPTLQVDHYPSAVNRATYQTSAFASAVYAGLKHYRFRQRQPIVAFLFAAVAIPRAYVNNLRRYGLSSLPSLFRQTAAGLAYMNEYNISRSERVTSNDRRN